MMAVPSQSQLCAELYWACLLGGLE